MSAAPPNQVPRNIRGIVAHLAYRMAEAICEDLRVRYDVGMLVHNVRYDFPEHVTMQTLAELGKRFRLRPASLRRVARAAEVIGVDEFERYLSTRGPDGFPLSWSHIEELATVRNKAARIRHADAAVTGLLSVRQLRTRIRSATTA
jgi:hypothetical protein